MPTVTFVLGLCGSGKTWLADRIVANQKFDESFALDCAKHQALINALKEGKNCVVVEIAYCKEEERAKIIKKLTDANINDLTIIWLCIENDLFRANKNCRERTNKSDPAGHVSMNEGYSTCYTYPKGAVVFKMWTKEC